MYGAGSITAVNTLLDGNGSANCGGSVTSLGHNLSTDATCPFTAVGDLQSAAASTAVDAGDDAQCTAVDRNGTPRPQGTHCDIGALETAGSGGGASAGSTTTTTTSVTTTPPTSSAPPAPPIPQPTPPPDAPHVAFTDAPQKPVVGRAIALTAETLPASAVPPTRFEWTFGDGSRATGARVTHVYGASGAFRVTLTVSDASGGTGSASARVRVTDGAPTVTLGRTPAPPAAGRPVTFKAFAVRRVGSWSATRITSWRWTFGDGTSAVGQQVTHTFASAGTYSVGVEIGDAGGSSALASSAVAVLPRNSVVAVDEGVAVAAAHTVTPPPAVVIGETISTRDGTSPAHH
jgi:PKD repeat protein